ncbi:MAG: hypothetical protein ACI308_08090 [Muribaculaceae bacterium]
MKKIYTIFAMMLISVASVYAQSATDLQFVYVDEDGEETGVVADNAVINVNTVTQDPNDDYADPYISSGLAVKNVSTGGRRVQIAYEITALPSGQHDICFFGSCLSDNTTGKFTYPRNINSVNALKAGSVTPLKAEWYFTAEGTATVVYQANVCTQTGVDGITPIYGVTAEGPKVTVNYVYDTSGIAQVTIDNPVKTEYYNIAGCRVDNPQDGIFIKRVTYANGKVATSKIIF